MGFKAEFNWALKLKQEQGLALKPKKGKSYSFSKDEYRIYPIGIPIDLVNAKWEAIAKVEIEESTNWNGKTRGTYRILKVYEGQEKEVLTKYWRETVEIILGKKPEDFSKAKVS